MRGALHVAMSDDHWGRMVGTDADDELAEIVHRAMCENIPSRDRCRLAGRRVAARLAHWTTKGETMSERERGHEDPVEHTQSDPVEAPEGETLPLPEPDLGIDETAEHTDEETEEEAAEDEEAEAQDDGEAPA